MKKMILICVVLSSMAQGQGRYTDLMSGSTALGSYSTGIWGNLAYPATMNKASLAVGVFGERRFLSDLTFYELGLRTALGQQPFQVQLYREGNTALSNFGASVAFSRKIDDRISLALRLGYVWMSAKGYRPKGSPLAGLGAVFHINEKCTWAVQADGINGLFLNHGTDRLALRTGLGYSVSELALVTVEMIKEQELPVQSLVALSYAFTEQLSVSLGYASQLASFLLGVSYQHAGIEFRISSGFHSALGPSAGSSFSYQMKNRVE